VNILYVICIKNYYIIYLQVCELVHFHDEIYQSQYFIRQYYTQYLYVYIMHNNISIRCNSIKINYIIIIIVVDNSRLQSDARDVLYTTAAALQSQKRYCRTEQTINTMRTTTRTVYEY